MTRPTFLSLFSGIGGLDLGLDPRFVAIALAGFAAGLGAVGALATRPPIPPSISRPVVRAITATVRNINPPPTTREPRAWTQPTTAPTGQWKSVPGSSATGTRTATRTQSSTPGSSPARSSVSTAATSTTIAHQAASTSATTTTSLSPPLSLPTTTTLEQPTSSTLVPDDVTTVLEVVP